MEKELQQPHVQQQARIVIDLMTVGQDQAIVGDKNKQRGKGRGEAKEKERIQRLVAWSKDSVGMLRWYTMSPRHPVTLSYFTPYLF